MNELLNNKFVLYLCAGIGIITAFIPIVGSLLNGGLHVDEPILLVEMERIAEGYLPYVDMHLNYPPLWFYMMADLKLLFHIPYGNYTFYLFLHYIFVISNAILVAFICQRLDNSRSISWLVAWLFVIASHWLSGNAVLFEMPSLFFGLLAVYLAVCPNTASHKILYFVIGIIAALSFLTKQFGAGFLLLVPLVLILTNQRQWYVWVLYAIGYILPIAVSLMIWGNHFVQSVLLNGYGTSDPTTDTATSLLTLQNIAWLLKRLVWFVGRCFPILLLLPVVYYCRENKRQIAAVLLGICGLLGFSLQFLFVHWDNLGMLHYNLYLVPFACILTACILTSGRRMLKWGKIIIISMLILTFIVNVYSTYYNRVWKVYLRSDGRKGEIEFAQSIASHIAPDSKVWIVDSNRENIYWIANFFPPNMREVGYSSGPLEITLRRAQLQVDSSDYVLHCVESDYCFPAFTDSMKTYLSQFETDTFNIGGWTLLLHNKHKYK